MVWSARNKTGPRPSEQIDVAASRLSGPKYRVRRDVIDQIDGKEQECGQKQGEPVELSKSQLPDVFPVVPKEIDRKHDRRAKGGIGDNQSPCGRRPVGRREKEIAKC